MKGNYSSHDLNDNLIKVTGRSRKVTEYKRDVLDRVMEMIRSNGTKAEVVYDAEDHITKWSTLVVSVEQRFLPEKSNQGLDASD